MGDGAMCHYCRKYQCECTERDWARRIDRVAQNPFPLDGAALLAARSAIKQSWGSIRIPPHDLARRMGPTWNQSALLCRSNQPSIWSSGLEDWRGVCRTCWRATRPDRWEETMDVEPATE